MEEFGVEIAKPYYYLSEFLNMEKKFPKEEDYQILKEILSFADNFDETKTATMLRNELAKEKLFSSNKDEVTGLTGNFRNMWNFRSKRT